MTASRGANPYGIVLLPGWRETTLGQLVDNANSFIQTGPFGSQLHAHDYKSEGVPVVMPQQLGDNRIDLDGIARISDEDRDRLSRHILRVGDIVFSRRGDVTRRALITSHEDGYLCGTGCLLIRLIHPDVDNRYLSLFFSLRQFKDYIIQRAVGATMPNLNTGILERIPIVLPPVDDQRRISEILSTYDDLIENNRRRMALLEESARLLYQEWFVRLRFPGHEHTRIINGTPEGWDRLPLESIVKVTHGYAFQGEYFSEEPTAKILATPGNFRIGGGIKYDKLKFYNDEGPLEPNYVFEPMDLMLTMTDLSKECDTLGYPAFVPKLDGQAFLHNQRVGKVMPLGSFFPKHFLYCLFCDGRYRHHVVGAATGTSVKHTSPKRILSYVATMPKDGTLMDEFEDCVRPCFQQINVLIEATQKLRAARDLLLPRLMSGQITT